MDIDEGILLKELDNGMGWELRVPVTDMILNSLKHKTVNGLVESAGITVVKGFLKPTLEAVSDELMEATSALDLLKKRIQHDSP